MIAYDNAVCTTLTTIDQLPSPLKDPVAQLVTDFLAGRKPTTFASYRVEMSNVIDLAFFRSDSTSPSTSAG